MKKLTWDKPIPKYGTSEWKAYKYVVTTIAKRGRNYRYYKDGDFEKLEKKGYERLNEKLHFPSIGQERVKQLRQEGFYATMILVPTSIKGRPDICVYYKPKSQ